MFRLRTALVALFLAAFKCHAQNVSIGDQLFKPAFSNESHIGSLKEYLPSGQTLNHWTNLFAIRVMHKESSPKDYITRLAAVYAKEHPNFRFALGQIDGTDRWWVDFITYGSEKDKLLGLFTRRSKEKFLEWNFFRAQTNADGEVVLYQYAERRYYKKATDESLDFKPLRQQMVPLLKTNEFSADH